ncbi:hypothetical protein GQ53DRAFT_786615 [Thozetella sp. PMI_491]|nr:hypothetical protein GQ53DRAFT_786615 [Thozetella sp. PMI_491]
MPPKCRQAAPVWASALPPLPASFHDLYASTVRTSTSDDPSLHQGRRRQNPHVVGHWPSHLYIEWHPSSAECDLLEGLIQRLQKRLRKDSPGAASITSFLLSDIGVPLPLHISLSRPVVFTTAQKDDFLGSITAAVRQAGVAPFALRCEGVEWHRTNESSRSFLVLRVRSTASGAGVNPELCELLRRCNGTIKAYAQPELYQWALDDAARDVGHAFHVSIAWSFGEVTEELKRLTEEVFGAPEPRESVRGAEIEVSGIKAKIGNVVTHVPLPERGRRDSGSKPQSLLGV